MYVMVELKPSIQAIKLPCLMSNASRLCCRVLFSRRTLVDMSGDLNLNTFQIGAGGPALDQI